MPASLAQFLLGDALWGLGLVGNRLKAIGPMSETGPTCPLLHAYVHSRFCAVSVLIGPHSTCPWGPWLGLSALIILWVTWSVPLAVLTQAGKLGVPAPSPGLLSFCPALLHHEGPQCAWFLPNAVVAVHSFPKLSS